MSNNQERNTKTTGMNRQTSSTNSIRNTHLYNKGDGRPSTRDLVEVNSYEFSNQIKADRYEESRGKSLVNDTQHSNKTNIEQIDESADNHSPPHAVINNNNINTFDDKQRRLPKAPSLAMATREGRLSADSAFSDGVSTTFDAKNDDVNTDSHSFKDDEAVAIISIREKIKTSRVNHFKSSEKVESLRKKLEETIVQSNSYQGEIEPLKEKVSRYEVIIEDLEDKLLKERTTCLQNERINLSNIARIEKKHNEKKQKRDEEMEERFISIKQELLSTRNELKLLKQAQKVLQQKDLASQKLKNSDNDYELGTSKSSLQLKQELIHVRQILEDSEQDRLKERKEKLSAIQNMIKLTKENSGLLEELDARKKSDVKETGEKFSRLSSKLKDCESKLQKLRQDKDNELEEVQRKYMDEIRQIKVDNVIETANLHKEIEMLKNTSSHSVALSKNSSNSYGNGKWSAIRKADRKHIQEMTEIIDEMETEGLGPAETSSDEVIRVLYNRWKDLENVTGQEHNNNNKNATQILKEEKRTMKMKIEDLQEANVLKDGQMKVLEMSLKRQIQDLLTEKKSAFFQMQKSIDLADNARHEADDCRTEHLKIIQTLNGKAAETDMLRENLFNLTNQFQAVDDDFSKLKRAFSVKNAELERVTKCLDLAQINIQTESQANRYATVENRKIDGDSEKTIVQLEEQVQNVQDNLSSSKLRCSRLQKERDDLLEDVTDLKICISQFKSDSSNDKETIDDLRNQISMLEANQLEKTRQFSEARLQIKSTSTNLLAAHHLLTSEEKRATSLEQDLELVISQLEQKESEIELLEETATELKSQLVKIVNDCDSMKISDEMKKLENENKLLHEENRNLTKELQYGIINTSDDSKKIVELKTKLENTFQTHKKELETQQKEYDNILADEKCRIKSKEREMSNVTKDIEMAYEILSDGMMGNNNELEDGKSPSVDDFIFMAELVSKQLKESQQLIKAKDQEIYDLQGEVNELETDVLKERKLLIDEKANTTEYKKSVGHVENPDPSSLEIQSELDYALAKIKKLQSDQVQKTSALNETRNALQETKSKYREHLTQIYNASNEELSKASADCQNLTREIKLRDQEIDQLRCTLESPSRGSHPCNNDLTRNQDDTIKAEFNELKKENECLTNQCDILIKRQNQQRTQDLQQQCKSGKGIKQMRCDNIELQNNVIELEADNAKLKRSLKKYHHRLKMINKKLRHTGKHDIENRQLIIYQELEKERNEKIDALDCLKSLVRDNETLTECISDLHRQFEAQRKELFKQKQLIRRADQSSLRDQEMMNYLKDVLESTLEREKELQCNETIELNALLQDKRLEIDKLRIRINDLEREMISKDRQLNQATSETFNLRATMEVTIGSQLTQRRNDDSSIFTTSTPNNHGNFMKRMTSLEASNSLLQKRLMDMQKWHHAIEAELVQSSPMRTNWEQFLRNSLNSFETTLSAMD